MKARASLVLLLAVAGCGREVAQTAERIPEEPNALDCTTPPGPVTLPAGPPLGDGSEPASPLVLEGYGPQAGPGLFVAARDLFRVYLNGELVRESAEARVPEFVPLSVLPGDNVLAVVVSAASGPPALLVHLDELERAHVSDASFRVTGSPDGNFHEPSYDDSGWQTANEVGPIGALPGCDPPGLFPAASPARWLSTHGTEESSAVFRKLVRIAPEGFGADTTGGGRTTPVLVASFDELVAAVEGDEPAVILLPEGVHDFRLTGADVREQLACPIPCPNDPSRIADTVLTGTETCPVPLVSRTRDERRLSIESNKTLVGLGRGAALRGVSVEIGGEENVIVRNVAVFDVNRALIEAGDAFGLGGARRVWIDHATTRWVSDGFTDVRPGTENVTFSFIHYDGPSADACTGQHPRTSQISDSSVTLHHSFFDRVDGNAPFVDHPLARVHVYNNVYTQNPGFAVGAGCGAQVFMEGNVLETVTNPTWRRDCSDDASLGLILAPPGSNLYRDDVGAHRGGDGNEPRDDVFEPPYPYTLDAPLDAWPTVLSRAGAGGPWALPLGL